MEKYLILAGIVGVILFMIVILALCQASGEADRHSERMMNQDKEDKGE